MMIIAPSSAAYTKRLVSSIRRDQKPVKFSFKGSGLPMPSKGKRVASVMSLLMRLSFFYLGSANTDSLSKIRQSMTIAVYSSSSSLLSDLPRIILLN
jgi:hypothetical protein